MGMIRQYVGQGILQADYKYSVSSYMQSGSNRAEWALTQF
jgi:hypothetical protein